jgi:hypothetical protein
MTPCSFVDTVNLITTDSPYRTIREMYIWRGKNSHNSPSRMPLTGAGITCSRAGQLKPIEGPYNSQRFGQRAALVYTHNENRGGIQVTGTPSNTNWFLETILGTEGRNTLVVGPMLASPNWQGHASQQPPSPKVSHPNLQTNSELGNYSNCTPSGLLRPSTTQHGPMFRRHGIQLTLILLTWRIWWAHYSASKWQMGFISAFKGLTVKQEDIGVLNGRKSKFFWIVTPCQLVKLPRFGSWVALTFSGSNCPGRE